MSPCEFLRKMDRMSRSFQNVFFGMASGTRVDQKHLLLLEKAKSELHVRMLYDGFVTALWRLSMGFSQACLLSEPLDGTKSFSRYSKATYWNNPPMLGNERLDPLESISSLFGEQQRNFYVFYGLIKPRIHPTSQGDQSVSFVVVVRLK